MHENLDKLDSLDASIYIVSGDSPEQQLELHGLLESQFGKSLPFVSDPGLELIDLFEMKNGDSAYRGYGMLDEDGRVVFHTINDHWGEQFDQTLKEIKKEYTKLNKE